MITPLYDRIVVERVEAEKITSGGIYIPDDSQEKPCEGIVRAVGKGRLMDNGDRAPMEVSVGDKVLLNKYSGTLIEYEGVEYLIMHEDEPLAVMEN
jgi:chaperonin GroES